MSWHKLQFDFSDLALERLDRIVALKKSTRAEVVRQALEDYEKKIIQEIKEELNNEILS